MNKIGNTLYKMDSKGKIRIWEISTGAMDDGVPYYSVCHGQQNGIMQNTEVIVPEGKNIGRANQTTAIEQCGLEAESLYLKQIERKGYSEHIPNKQPTLPMLAHKYADYSHKIEWPAIASPKLDGIRLIIEIKSGKVKCTSRTGKEILNLEHITDELLDLKKDLVLDGELYSDAITFEEIVSIVRKTRSKDPRILQIYFYAFDIINDQGYHTRVLELDRLLLNTTYSKIVPWRVVRSQEDLVKIHTKNKKDKYEGTMIRNMASLYQPNKRSTDLLKVKDFLDDEFIITGWKTGKGKFANIPTFSLLTKEKKHFEAVPKGTEEIREEFLINAESYVGQLATVRFFEYTADGIPRFPVIICIRNYE